MEFNSKYFHGDYNEKGIFEKDDMSCEENQKFIKEVESIGIRVTIFRGKEEPDWHTVAGDGLNAQIGISGVDKHNVVVDFGFADKDFKTVRESIRKEIVKMKEEGRIN